MSSSEINLFESHGSAPRTSPGDRPGRRTPPWLLPTSLAVAFAAIFLWFLRDHLLPSQRVTVAPVVLLADLEDHDAGTPPSAQTDGNPSSPENADAEFGAPMLFQAAGWFEPDPLPIRATALVDGVVDRVRVLEGEAVSKGQKLASLIAEDTDLMLAASKRALEAIVAEHHMHLATIPAVEAKAESVQGQIEAARAKLEELEDRDARIRRLLSGTVSEQEVTAARLAVESQRAEINALQSEYAAQLAKLDAIVVQSAVFNAQIAAAKVAIAQNELARTRVDILSPVDGVVLELKAAPGQKKMLAMDDPESATVAILFETGKLQARVDVPLADAAGLIPGQPALITSDFLPNTEFRGRVTRIVGAADLQRNTLQAKVRVLDPDPRLRPEMLCRVKFLRPTASPSVGTSSPGRDSSRRRLFVPTATLIDRSGNDASAWIVSDDGKHATRKRVSLGAREIDGHIAVTNGLLAGQQVILPPHRGLSEGRRIRVSPTQP